MTRRGKTDSTYIRNALRVLVKIAIVIGERNEMLKCCLATLLLFFYQSGEVFSMPACDIRFLRYAQHELIESPDDIVIKEKLSIKFVLNENNVACSFDTPVWPVHPKKKLKKIYFIDQEQKKIKALNSFAGMHLIRADFGIMLKKQQIELFIEAEYPQLRGKPSDRAFYTTFAQKLVEGFESVEHTTEITKQLSGSPFHLGFRVAVENREDTIVYKAKAELPDNRSTRSCENLINNHDVVGCRQENSTYAVGWTNMRSYEELATDYAAINRESTGIDFTSVIRSQAKLSSNEVLKAIENEVISVRKQLKYQEFTASEYSGLSLRIIDDIVRDGYGVCREYSALLAYKLNQRGIDAYPVLVNIRSDQKWIPAVPFMAFDHVMVFVPSIGYYVDPTDTRLHPLSLFEEHIGRIGLDIRTKKLFRLQLAAGQQLNLTVN